MQLLKILCPATYQKKMNIQSYIAYLASKRSFSRSLVNGLSYKNNIGMMSSQPPALFLR